MSEKPLRLVIAGGGTGGHVQPAVATLQVLRELARIEPVWVGSLTGVERDVAAGEEIPFVAIRTGKLRRYVSLRTPVDAVRVPLGLVDAYRLLRRLRPDIVFSTGGFVSVPTVIAARRLRIPTLTHEQTAILGLANRINVRFADVIALSYERSHALVGRAQARVMVTGNPIRPSLFDGKAPAAYAAFGLDPDLPLTYITGGALGARSINIAVAEALPRLLEQTQVIHQCGRNPEEAQRLENAAGRLSPDLRRRYVVRPFVGPELADIYAAASLVIGRAGAGTVAELAALGKPSILIPLPGSAGGEQEANARMLADAGGSVLLPQEETTPDRLVQTVRDLFASAKLEQMAAAACSRGNPGAARRLADALLDLAGRVPVS